VRPSLSAATQAAMSVAGITHAQAEEGNSSPLQSLQTVSRRNPSSSSICDSVEDTDSALQSFVTELFTRLPWIPLVKAGGLYWKVIMSVRLSVVAFGFKGSFARFALPEFKTL
jgi:hypothetical protein